MKSMNRVELIGYLGKDPVIYEYSNGNAMAILRLATNRYYQSREGKTVKATQWHTAKLWGKQQIDKFRNYLMKGSHILVAGELEYRTFQGKDGQTRSMTMIRANYLVDLDR
jgi:single-strand DNA-binding protein